MANSSDTTSVSDPTRHAESCRKARVNKTARYRVQRCNGCSGKRPSWHRRERRRDQGRSPSGKATKHRAVMFGQICRSSRRHREQTQIPPRRRDSQILPFPPDGIELYSKNSAVSHLPFESSGIWADRHVARTADSDQQVRSCRFPRCLPADALEEFGIETQTPDQFIHHLIDLYPDEMLQAADTCRASLPNSPKTREEYLSALEKGRDGLKP